MEKIIFDKAETSFYKMDDYGGRKSADLLYRPHHGNKLGKEVFSDTFNKDDLPGLQNLAQQSFENFGFFEFEPWDSVQTVSAKILDVKAGTVTCECVVDKEAKTFQSRSFPSSLFSHLNLANVQFVTIKMKIKAGSMRIDIFNGEQIVDKSIFAIEDIWKERDYSKLTQPFKGKYA